MDLGGCTFLGRAFRTVKRKLAPFVCLAFFSFLCSGYNRSDPVVPSLNYGLDYEQLVSYSRSLNPVHSAYLGLLKYSWAYNGNEGIDSSALRSLPGAMRIFKGFFDPICSQSKFRSLEEVWGLSGGSKSPGFPWTYLGFDSRQECMASRAFYHFMKRKYLPAVTSGVVVSPRFSGSTKDEVRERDKVTNLKIRLYMGGPQEFQIWRRMLFQDMMDRLHTEGKFRTPFMVGMNKFAEWDEIHRRLRRHPNEKYTDLRGMDASVRKLLLAIVYSWRTDMLANRHNPVNIRDFVQTLFQQYVNKTCVMADGYEFLVRAGVASGDLLTSDDDTLVNILVWLMLWSSHYEGDLSHFQKHVCLFVYGDDTCLSYSDEVAHVFTDANIANFFAKLGLQVEFTIPQFLSQNFHSLGEVVVPKPVDKYSRVASLLYPDKKLSRMDMWDVAMGHLIDGFWDDTLRVMLFDWLEVLQSRYGVKRHIPPLSWFLSLYGLSDVTVLKGRNHASAVTMSQAQTVDKLAKAEAELLAAKPSKSARKKAKRELLKKELEDQIRLQAAVAAQAAPVSQSSAPKVKSTSVELAGVGSGTKEKKKAAHETHMNQRIVQSVKKYEEKADVNAYAYVDTMVRPSIPNVRIPDSNVIPSLTTQLVSRITVPTVTGSTSGFANGIVFYPGLYQGYTVLGAMTTVDSGGTWSLMNNSQYTGFLTVANMYRVVSMGVRVIDAGAMMERGFTMVCGNCPIFSGPGGATPLTSFANIKTVRYMDSATCANECSMFWVPFASSEVPLFASGTASLTGSAWRNVAFASPQLYDNALALYSYSNAASAPSDTFTFELTINCEYVPNMAYNYIGTPTQVASSTGSIDAARAAAGLKGAASPGVVVDGKVKSNDSSNLLTDIFNGVKKGFQFVTEAAEFIGPLLGGLFGKYPARDVERRHILAVLLDRHSMSPFACDDTAFPSRQDVAKRMDEFKTDTEFILALLKAESPYKLKRVDVDDLEILSPQNGVVLSGSARRSMPAHR